MSSIEEETKVEETKETIRFLYNGEYYTGDILKTSPEPTMISEPKLDITTDASNIITGLEGSLAVGEDLAVGNDITTDKLRCQRLFVNNTEIKAEIQGQVDFLYKYFFP